MALLFTKLSNNRGIAIVAVTMVLVVVALLGGSIISQTNQDTQLSNVAYQDKQAVYFAESAKERGYQEILADENFAVAGSDGILNNQAMPGGSYSLRAIEISPSPDKVVQLIATGFTDGGDSRQVNVVAKVVRENVFVWNNAIFGGSGQIGGVIKGNCAIHGSVHLLGENVTTGNNSIEALDLSGASLIHNNYAGMPAALAAKVPALPTTVYGGETVDSIDAKLRVKNGSVGVSGSSEIGEINIVGNSTKETMDGIYIETDPSEIRWTGNQVIDGIPNADSVQSDNGTNGLYDLGDAVVMPTLGTPYDTYATYEEYFSDAALHMPPMVFDDSTSAFDTVAAYQAGGGFDGSVDVQLLNAATGEFSVSSTNPIDGTTNSISYNPKAAAGVASLTMTGMVQFEGDVTIGKKNLSIACTGKGTMLAAVPGTVPGTSGSGSISVHSNMLPIGMFPTDSVFGLMAKYDIYLANGPGDSQLMLAGAFFAENQIVSTKQNEILGTFVCNYFDMGTNVPKIYQVPALKDNLPPGLIASAPIWLVTGFEERSWQIEDSPTAFIGGS